MILPYWRIFVVGIAAGLITAGTSYVIDVLELPPHTLTYFLVRFGVTMILIMPLLVWAQRSAFLRNRKPPSPPT